MGAHTPGPWHLHNGAFALVCAARKSICAMRNPHSDDNEANARLIAAAPDMLQMLRIVERYFDTEEPHPILQADINKVIALATGGHR